MNYITGINLYKILDAADLVEKHILQIIPYIKSESVISGLSGVFSGFAKHVNRISKEYNVDPRDVYVELGNRRVVGGQEDLIIEVVIDLVTKKK
jgi:4-hydroxy 2-oxovalerate aldolase